MRQIDWRWLPAVVLGGLLAAGPAFAEDDEGLGFELTPPRISLTDGEVSFWRAGAEDWAPARVNTPLAAGDGLYTLRDANLELQIGARAYLRAGEETQFGLTTLEPDYLQLRVTQGQISLDLRALEAGQTFEVATPNAAFTIEHTGYYRIAVDDEATTLTNRRGGRATLTLASGDSLTVTASEQVVVSGVETPLVESYAAAELDAWDRWNYARTDSQLDAVSARYVPSGVYGTADLDQYGDWRVVPSYGALWVPRGVPVGWVPYSTGRWLYDPHYSWSWVDDHPWGWAPYHYGRWVHVSGSWGWAPGPLVRRAYYAPALVAFYGGSGLSVGISLSTPHLGWVALGWGEPLIPWWGTAHYRRAPRWGGWGGPRFVNRVVVKRKTVIRVRDIHDYHNAHVRDAIVAVHRDRFGRGPVAKARRAGASRETYRALHGGFEVKPHRSSLVAASERGRRPPRAVVQREVVARRASRARDVPGLEPRGAREGREDFPRAVPPARVAPQKRNGRVSVSDRPPFAKKGEAERQPGPPAPRFRKRDRTPERERAPRAERAPVAPRKVPAATERRQERSDRPRVATPPSTPRPDVKKRERQERRERVSPSRQERSKASRKLPGEPANRVYRSRRESTPRRAEQAAPREASPQPRKSNSGRRGPKGNAGRRER